MKHLGISLWLAPLSSVFGASFPLFRINMPQDFSLPDLFLKAQFPSLNPSSRLLWSIAVCNLLWCLWSGRNKRRHDGGVCCAPKLKQFLFLSLKDSAALAFPSISSTVNSSSLFGLLGLSPLRLVAHKFIPVVWQPPPFGWVKVNTDGSFVTPVKQVLAVYSVVMQSLSWAPSLTRLLPLVQSKQSCWRFWRQFVLLGLRAG